MARKADIVQKSTGLDYARYSVGPLIFDYEAMMAEVGYSSDDVRRIQAETGIGRTPLLELRRLTALVRQWSRPGKGAQIFVKDEAANPSGSFKDRRASITAYHARRSGRRGVIAATSGNYGVALASQAAANGLQAVIVQEVFDSLGRGQPEILEKGRKCEAVGAEVIQTTVGPELFYLLLVLTEETGFFNASLYTPFSVLGIETLGTEIADQVRRATGRDPDVVAITHAGGGNVTGVARGLRHAGCTGTEIVAVSVDLAGLHMASDRDFNRKSFTTGHTGFAMPFTMWPDRVDMPRSAARPLRYIDRFVTVTQGEVFLATEGLAQFEGLERGAAGNTSLAAALALAREMDREQVIVVSETEWTGAGKHPIAQLAFAAGLGIGVVTGDPRENLPGRRIAIPSDPRLMSVREVDLDQLRAAYVQRAVEHVSRPLNDREVDFLAVDTRAPRAKLAEWLTEMTHSGSRN
jgi:cysteine synthase